MTNPLLIQAPVGSRFKSTETGIIYERVPSRMSDGADAFVEVRNGKLMKHRTGLFKKYFVKVA